MTPKAHPNDFADDALDVIWLSRNMTEAIYQTLRDPESAPWDELTDAQTVIARMAVGDLRDALMLRIRKAKREA